MKKILTVLSITICMTIVLPAAVYADGPEELSLTDLTPEELSLTDLVPEEELKVDEAVPASEDIGEITAIDAPGKLEYSFEFKNSLADVVEELPKTLTVHSGDDTVSIDVKWICEKDYNDTLGEYPFIPDMTGYTLAEGTVIPKITVTFEEEVADGPKGLNPITIPGHEIPFTADAGSGFSALTTTAIPSSYNPMKEGKLPAIRQQRGGTCWAHATIGAMETDLIHDGKAGTDIDLSEMHLAYYFYNKYEDPKGCRKNDVKQTGGYYFLDNGSTPEYAVKTLSNLVGAVPESVVPKSTDFSTFNPDRSYVVSKDKAQIRNAYFINAADRAGIKTAVMEHGGVAVAYWDEDEYYNATHASYYCTDGAYVNHAVMIVGWDDGFSKSWFSSTPAGDGAWLIRNSWGGDNDKYSHQGYFWMSYYDKSLTNGSNPAIAIDADTNVFGNCYAYDDFPLPLSLGYPVRPQDSVSVTYTVSGHEAVKGIGIELETANVNIKATAKNKTTGQSVTGSLKTGNAGFYTVTFSKPLEVYDRSTVEVTLNLTSSTESCVSIAEEYPYTVEYGSYTFTGSVDRGFYLNGTKITYSDLRVKLYTDDSNATYNKVTGVTLKDKASVNIGSTVTLTATVLPSDATYKTVTWSSSDTAVATVSSQGVVKGKKAGKAKITVTTVDGQKTATCVVTVNPVKVKRVTLKSKATVYKGKTIKLEPVITPNNATNKKVTWTSSKKSVATVDKNGKVKGKKAGKAKITVTTNDGKKKATCTVTVKNPVKVKEVRLNNKATVKVGKTVKLTARIKPTNATDKSVTWTSSKKSVATVDKNGKVKGKKAGKAKITVTTNDGKKKATCTVTVK